MIAILDHIEDITPGIHTFWFKPERHMHYTAGQFTELYLPHDNPDDRGERRWFTLSSSPTDPLLAITTKFAPDGQQSSSFKQALRELQIGSEVSVADAMGDFVLPKDKSIPMLFVAGGMGITPVHSMIKYLSDSHEQRDIQLLYGVHSDTQMIYRRLFDEYGLTSFTPLAQETSTDWRGETDSITAERVIALLGNNLETHVYLSGPEPLIKIIAKELEKYGVAKHRIITDFFPGYNQF
ncbi:MAG: FAD-dependent oxidoreductase [Candidatus Saccharimonadales bacterium]